MRPDNYELDADSLAQDFLNSFLKQPRLEEWIKEGIFGQKKPENEYGQLTSGTRASKQPLKIAIVVY